MNCKIIRWAFAGFVLATLLPRLALADDAEPSWITGGDDKMLGTTGTTLRDHKGSGDVVQLRGVNLGGWLEWQDWMCPTDSSGTLPDNNPGHNGYDFQVRDLLVKRFGAATADDLVNSYEDAWITTRDLDNIKELGMNVARLTFAWDTVMNEDGTWRDDAFKHMDWFVKNAFDRGIYTIIDFHAFLPPGGDGSANGYWKNSAQLDQTVQIWTHIAEHYKGNPAVAMYDLLNEPNNSAPKGKSPPKAEIVCGVYDKIYHAIRNVDPDHLIAMEGMWDWKSLRDGREAGYRNVVYSFHWYHWGTKNTEEINTGTDDDLHAVEDMHQAWTVPCFIGEFNLFGDPNAWRHALGAYQSAGLNWALWTYKNKASDTNSWGVYTTIPGKAPPIPNLATDSAEDIRSKWKAWSTDDDTFALNPMLGPILQEQLKQP